MKARTRMAVEAALVAALGALIAVAWARGALGPAPRGRAAPPAAPATQPAPASAPASRPLAPATQAASAPLAVTLTGRVVDALGRAVPGAQVTVREVALGGGPRLVQEAGELGVLAGRLPYPDELAPPASQPASGPVLARAGAELAAAVAGPDGEFTLRGIPAHPVVLEARHRLFACGAPQRLSLSAGTTVGAITLRVSPGTLLRGRITDAGDAPLAGAVVAPIFADSVGAQADERGDYRFEGRCGDQALQITHPGYKRATVSLRLDPAERERVLDIKLARGGEVLRGRVLDARERPVAGVRVTVVEPGRRGGQTAVSGPRGDFAATGLGPGPYRVEARHQDYPPVDLTDVGLGQDLTVRFPAGGGVSGLVRDEVNAAPLARAEVELRPRGGGGAAAGAQVTRRGARFEARGLAPGPWRLNVRAPGYVARAIDVDVPPTDRVGEVTARDVLVELTRGAVAAGEVRDEHGDRIPGAEVRLGSHAVRSGARGEFRLEELPAGDQVLRARRAGYVDGELQVTLRAGDETRGLDLRLQRAP
ncbi:MAG TPA: carboxypeptidase-like regulatory domain-containing protein [Polyangia bacterium]|jgi:hypothetical protein